jgi:hypothetical protein
MPAGSRTESTFLPTIVISASSTPGKIRNLIRHNVDQWGDKPRLFMLSGTGPRARKIIDRFAVDFPGIRFHRWTYPDMTERGKVITGHSALIGTDEPVRISIMQAFSAPLLAGVKPRDMRLEETHRRMREAAGWPQPPLIGPFIDLPIKEGEVPELYAKAVAQRP